MTNDIAIQKVSKELLSWDLRNQIEGGTVYNTMTTKVDDNAGKYLLRSANDFVFFDEKSVLHGSDSFLIENFEDNGKKNKVELNKLPVFIAKNLFDIYQSIEVKTANFTAEFRKTYILRGTSQIEITLPTAEITNGNTFRIINRLEAGFKILIPANNTVFVGIEQYDNANPFEYFGSGSIGVALEFLTYDMPEQREWYTIADLNFAGFIEPPETPTSSGIRGQQAFDNDWHYFCVATNVWKRNQLSNWSV